MLRRSAIVFAVLVSACGGSGGSDEPLPPPEALIASSAEAMGSVETASFKMERGGAPILISGLRFDSAEGIYVAPDSSRAVLEVKAGDLSVALATISIAERTWLTNPLTGEWEELTPGTGFNPSIVFDNSLGWVPLLTEDLSDPVVDSRRDGAYLMTGTVAAQRVDVLTAGLAGGADVPITLQLDVETGHILRAEFTTEGEEGASDWLIVLDDFDVPATVEPPPGT